MQTPLSDFPRKVTSKKNLVNQQKMDKSNIPTNDQALTPNSGVTRNFFYKLSEIVYYTSSALSDTYNTLTTGGAEPELSSTRKRYYDDVMQINADDSDGAYGNDEMSDDAEMDYSSEEVNKKVGRKEWTVNDDVEEQEPPPPYDNSWAMPKTTNSESTSTSSSSSPKRTSFTTPNAEGISTSTSNNTSSQATNRRRQIRVRRPRRLLRRKSASTEASTPRGGGGRYDNPDELLLKVNDKLSEMIEQGRAALVSTVEITDVDVLLAEEREREERIMKEFGLQTSVGRKGRKNTTDYEYFTSISDGNYSSPESSYCDHGYGTYGRHGSGFASPSGYETPDPYTSHPSHGHYNTPSQFGSPGVYHQTQNGFNFSNLGFGMKNNNVPNRYYASPPPPPPPSGFGDPALSKGFGTISGISGFARFGRYGPNNNGGFGNNYGFGSSNAGGFGPNSFGTNGGYGTNGIYNNNRGFMC